MQTLSAGPEKRESTSTVSQWNIYITKDYLQINFKNDVWQTIKGNDWMGIVLFKI